MSAALLANDTARKSTPSLAASSSSLRALATPLWYFKITSSSRSLWGSGPSVDADTLAGQIAEIHDRLDGLQSGGSVSEGLEQRVEDLIGELDATPRLFFHPAVDYGANERLKPGVVARSGVQRNV